jgi:hypothetical protein
LGCLLSFANFADVPEFADRAGYLSKLERWDYDRVMKNDRRHLFIWLINRHWESFLAKWPLIIEGKRRRTFFRLVGEESTTISYKSKMGRKATRDVVKKRGEEPYISFEHEGLHYAVKSFFGSWALEFRPTYVFTERDAETLLGRLAQTRRATKRYKFARNPGVENDLVFWARYLSQGQPTISIGNVGVDDLILDSDYLSAEVPKSDIGDKAFEATN